MFICLRLFFSTNYFYKEGLRILFNNIVKRFYEISVIYTFIIFLNFIVVFLLLSVSIILNKYMSSQLQLNKTEPIFKKTLKKINQCNPISLKKISFFILTPQILNPIPKLPLHLDTSVHEILY